MCVHAKASKVMLNASEKRKSCPGRASGNGVGTVSTYGHIRVSHGRKEMRMSFGYRGCVSDERVVETVRGFDRHVNIVKNGTASDVLRAGRNQEKSLDLRNLPGEISGVFAPIAAQPAP
jgi:hypothetical protein